MVSISGDHVSGPEPSPQPVDLLLSFDTTGSMSACIEEVQKCAQQVIERFFKDVPNLRIAIIAHGDYCDHKIPACYVIKWVDFTNDVSELCRFIQTAGGTTGGDWEECYELVLRRAHKQLSWRCGSQRTMVMMGDAMPHPADDPQNEDHINWRLEAYHLADKMGVCIHSVQFLSGQAYYDERATEFWASLAALGHGCHLVMDNFHAVVDVILGIVYRAEGIKDLKAYAMEVRQRDGMLSQELQNMFTILGIKDMPDLATPVADPNQNDKPMMDPNQNCATFSISAFYKSAPENVNSELKVTCENSTVCDQQKSLAKAFQGDTSVEGSFKSQSDKCGPVSQQKTPKTCINKIIVNGDHTAKVASVEKTAKVPTSKKRLNDAFMKTANKKLKSSKLFNVSQKAKRHTMTNSSLGSKSRVKTSKVIMGQKGTKNVIAVKKKLGATRIVAKNHRALLTGSKTTGASDAETEVVVLGRSSVTGRTRKVIDYKLFAAKGKMVSSGITDEKTHTVNPPARKNSSSKDNQNESKKLPGKPGRKASADAVSTRIKTNVSTGRRGRPPKSAEIQKGQKGGSGIKKSVNMRNKTVKKSGNKVTQQNSKLALKKTASKKELSSKRNKVKSKQNGRNIKSQKQSAKNR